MAGDGDESSIPLGIIGKSANQSKPSAGVLAAGLNPETKFSNNKRAAAAALNHYQNPYSIFTLPTCMESLLMVPVTETWCPS
jgi:hypothetical protein